MIIISKIRKISLFSGIEAFDMALHNIGVEIETLALCEINKYSATSCKFIHNYNDVYCHDDVCTFDGTKYSNVDLLTHGSPCTSMSLEGNKTGADKDSGTASSLLWQSVRIIEECLPKVVIWENVYTVTNHLNKHNFEAYLQDLVNLGYTNCHNTYCGLDYNTPQNRNRMVVVSIHESSDLTFKIPNKLPLNMVLKDILEENVSEEYNISPTLYNQLVLGKELNGNLRIKNATKLGYAVAEPFDGIDFNRPTSKTRRGRVQKKRSNTILTTKTLGTYDGERVRYFTPLEYWRLQGFSDSDYYKSRESLSINYNLSEKEIDTQMYFQAGNSIPVKILEEVFKELYIIGKV